MTNFKSLAVTLIALPLLTLAACGTTSRQAPPPGSQVAMGPRTSDAPLSLGSVAGKPQARIPDEVLHDPAQRFALMERLRTQVVAETRAIPEARWRGEVRPAVRLQLERAGLQRTDVDFLLWEIDQAKSSNTL